MKKTFSDTCFAEIKDMLKSLEKYDIKVGEPYMHKQKLSLSPRIIRVRDVCEYSGMCDRVFNREVRPYLTEIKIGIQGVGFDRFELDQVLDDYISRYGRAPTKNLESEQCKKIEKPAVVLSSGTGSGISTKPSTVSDFVKAVALVKKQKQKGS
jgi:hypothetical protein